MKIGDYMEEDMGVKKEISNLFNLYLKTEEKKEREEIQEKIYLTYKSFVKKVAFSIVKNYDDSEDITQNVFLKIFRAQSEQIPQTNITSWIYKITKNTALDFLKKKKYNINIDEIYEYESTNNEIDDFINQDAYKRLISKLSKKEQEIVSLKILGNLTFKEIGLLLDKPTATVSWIYYKSLNTLKSIWINFILTIISFSGYIINKNNVPRSNGSLSESINIDINNSIKIHSIKTRGLLIMGIFFFILTIYFFIILKKHHKNYKSKSSK